MDHKAYEFDYGSFERELAPVLRKALATGSVAELRDYVEQNRTALKDPDDGTPLPSDSPALVQSLPDAEPFDDVQRLGDIALTKYYDPTQVDGLTAQWETAETKLDGLGKAGAAVLLGQALAEYGRFFDPGLQGSYFQSANSVRRNVEVMNCEELHGDPLMDRWRRILERAAAKGQGLYVTF